MGNEYSNAPHPKARGVAQRQDSKGETPAGAVVGLSRNAPLCLGAGEDGVFPRNRYCQTLSVSQRLSATTTSINSGSSPPAIMDKNPALQNGTLQTSATTVRPVVQGGDKTSHWNAGDLLSVAA